MPQTGKGFEAWCAGAMAQQRLQRGNAFRSVNSRSLQQAQKSVVFTEQALQGQHKRAYAYFKTMFVTTLPASRQRSMTFSRSSYRSFRAITLVASCFPLYSSVSTSRINWSASPST